MMSALSHEAFKRVISRNQITQVVVSPLDIPSAIAKSVPKETSLVDEIGKTRMLRAAHSGNLTAA